MKRILLSLSVLAMAYTVNSQTLVDHDFESFDMGELDGQGSWATYSNDDDHLETDFQIVNIPNGSKGIELKGQAGSESTRDMFKNINWENRTTGNDYLYYGFTLQTGATSTSANYFEMGLYNTDFGTIAAFYFDASTRELYSGIYNTSGGETKERFYYLGEDAQENPEALILSENSVVELNMYFDKSNGSVILQGVVGEDALFTKSYFTARSGEDPKYLDFYSYAGTDNVLSSSIFIDDVIVKARPCLLYDTKPDATFSYTEASICNTLSAISPTLTDVSVTGEFTSTPAGLSLNSTNGAVTPTTSMAGTYTIEFTTDVEDVCESSSSVSLTIEDCSSLPEHLTSAFSVAPNPAKDFITVTLSDNSSKGGLISLMTSEGKEVETRVVSANKEEVFNVSNLEAGIYFVQFADKIEKVVIQ